MYVIITYGGGPAKLQMICNQMPKINITLDQAKEYVKVYRNRFNRLVAFWRKYSLHPLKEVQSKVVELFSTRQLYYGGIQNDKYFDGRFWNNMWGGVFFQHRICLLYTSPSPRDRQKSRMPSSA